MMLAAASLALLAGVGTQPAFTSPGDLQRWLTYYYRKPRPELVVAALVALERELPRHGSTLEAQARRGGMRSFFGLVLAKSPAAVVDVENHDFAPGTRRFVEEALWRCGTAACADILSRWGVDAGGPAPDVRAVPLSSKAAIDDLWASYSATGDGIYVERVIAALPDSPSAPGSEGVGGAALRSLISNAASDDDVMALCIQSAAGADPGRRAVLEDVIERARRARTDQGGS